MAGDEPQAELGPPRPEWAAPAGSRRRTTGKSFVAPGSTATIKAHCRYKGWRVLTVWECALKVPPGGPYPRAPASFR